MSTNPLKSLSDHPLNAQNLKLLLSYAGSLIPFIGAGLSADFGYPPWHKLIYDLSVPAGIGDLIAKLLSDNRFEEAAEEIWRRLPNQFDDTLRETFDLDQLARPISNGAVRHIPLIARGPVLTTNFDCVLEAVFSDSGRPFRQVFSGAHIREASRMVQLNEQCLLKLHGDYRDSQSRILTLTEYIREYGTQSHADVSSDLPLPLVLSQALASHPFLFLGCSLKNDRTIGVISTLAKRYPGVVHFALLSGSEVAPARLEQLDLWNIRPLFFPAGEFGKIDEFLQGLARYCMESEAAGAAKKRLSRRTRQRKVRVKSVAVSGRTVMIARTRELQPLGLPDEERPARINGYKLFYFRRMRKLGRRVLSRTIGIRDRDLGRLESVHDNRGVLGPQCFQICNPSTLTKLEEALDCRGELGVGKPDDFLTQYMLFYKMYRGTQNVGDKDEDQLELASETKAVVFDFDGTLTVRTDEETTWEKIWVKLGYSINDCAELHHKYSQGKFSHQEWCRITNEKFRVRGFRRQDLREIAKSIKLMEGTRETLEVLRERGVRLYILSGSIKEVIRDVLGDLKDLFDEIQANEIWFDATGIIREIRGTKFDFEGKAKFLSRVIEENRYSPYDVLFVGNSCNDIFASRSGARTLCVNPKATNPDAKEHWTYLIRRMDSLSQILKYAEI